jgi:hypothetical protein
MTSGGQADKPTSDEQHTGIDDVFDTWQPRYAALGVATFPVRFVVRDGKLDKVPAVRHYMKLGLRASTELTRKFAHADGIGLALGNRSGLAVVDVDTKNENVVADVLAFYGPSPLVARTPSGGHHVYYRHDGRQRRRIRDPYWREREAPVDVLGNGFVVAPPSRSPRGTYAFEQGGLDDLQRLPVLRGGAATVEPSAPPPQPVIPIGRRNNELFRFCMKQALSVRSFAELLDAARRFNQTRCTPPMENEEMNITVHSAWHITEQGRNHFGQHGAWLGFAEVATMVRNDQDGMVLLAFLRANNGPWASFMCANGMAETFGWTRKRLAEARHRLVELGHIELLRPAATGRTAVYRWR